MSPDIVRKIITEAGYEIVKSNLEMSEEEKKASLYYERDILVIFKFN